MSYTKLSGGELTALELNALSGGLVDDYRGTINTPVALAALVDTLFSEGSDLVGFLSDLVPREFLGEGRYAYGPFRQQSLPIALDGSSWNSDVINTNNLSKKDFAVTGTGLLLAIAVSYLVKNFGLNGGATAAVAAGGVISRRLHRASVMSALEQQSAEAQQPPAIANSAKTEIALGLLLSGMAKNSSAELKRGIRILQD
jgi:hypothetical protein